eukprot:273683_1
MRTLEMNDNVLANYELFIRIYNTDNQILNIIPSLEVQLLWIVHALNPKQYYNDCINAFNKPLPVKLLDNVSLYYTNLNRFRCDIQQSTAPHSFKQITSQITKCNLIQNFDIKSAVTRQIKFVDKMNSIQALKNITSLQIQQSIQRYYKFLYLMKTNKRHNKKAIYVPTLDLDLIWHSHLLDAENYHKMSRFLFPNLSVINHDDNISDEKLNHYRINTQLEWNRLFGQNDYSHNRAFHMPCNQCNYSWKISKLLSNIYMNDTEIIWHDTDYKPLHQNINRLRGGMEGAKEGENFKKKTKPLEVQTTKCNSDKDTDKTNPILEKHYKCCSWVKEQVCWKWFICGICFLILIICPLVIATLVIYSTPNPISTYASVYQNNIRLNANGTITINTLITWDRRDLDDFDVFKSIAYVNRGFDDIIDYNTPSNGGVTYSNNPYSKNKWYWIEMYFDYDTAQFATTTFSYTLSNNYLCCSKGSDSCESFELHLPWLHRWKYEDIVQDFKLNVYYENPYDVETTSNWDDKKYYDDEDYGLQNDLIYKIHQKGIINKNFKLYFHVRDGFGVDLYQYCEYDKYSHEFTYGFIQEQIMDLYMFILMMV